MRNSEIVNLSRLFAVGRDFSYRIDNKIDRIYKARQSIYGDIL